MLEDLNYVQIKMALDLPKEEEMELRNFNSSFKLPVLTSPLSYPIPNCKGWDKVLADFIQFANEKGFAEEDMSYLIGIKRVASMVSCHFMPHSAIDSPEVEIHSFWLVAAYIYDDETDTELQDVADDAFVFNSLFLGSEISASVYDQLKSKRKKAIVESCKRFFELIHKFVPNYENKCGNFHRALDEYLQCHSWAVLEANNNAKSSARTDSNTLLFRRIRMTGIKTCIELIYLLLNVNPSSSYYRSVIVDRIIDLACYTCMVINDIFSFPREAHGIEGQNVVVGGWRTGMTLHESFNKAIKETTQASIELDRLMKLIECKQDVISQNVEQVIKDVVNGTTFVHLTCPRYNKGVTFKY